MMEDPLQKLRIELIEANRLFLERCPDDEELRNIPFPDHPQRKAILKQLNAIIPVIQSQTPDVLCLPLLELLTALVDLDFGKQAEFLKPRKLPGGGHRRGLMDETRYALAAATIEFLERSGVNKADATKMAAKALDDDAKSLSRWIRNIKERPLKIQITRLDFTLNGFREIVKSPQGGTYQEACKQIGMVYLKKLAIYRGSRK